MPQAPTEPGVRWKRPGTALRRRRVLFVAINYAPEHSGTAPYTAGAAEYLASQGNHVKVLTGFPHYPDWSVPAEARRRRSQRELLAGVDVHRLRHFVPASQSSAKRALYELTFAAHLLAPQRVNNPDVVVAVVPNLLSAASAARIADRADARLVVWMQDSMSAAATQSGISGGQKIARLVSSVERYVLRVADTVIVISEGFRSLVVTEGVDPGKVVVVRNWSHVKPPTADRRATRSRLGWGNDKIIALHAGNMGLKQGLENVVEAGRLATTHAKPVQFVLMGDGNQREHLQRQAVGASNVVFLPPASGDTFSDVLSAADVLLINEAETVLDMSLPSKLTSYLVAGRPVIAAVSPHGGTAREVQKTGAGLVVESGQPDLLLKEVLRVGADPAAATARGALGREYADRMLSGSAALECFSAALDARQQLS